jgi:hypothetical protein
MRRYILSLSIFLLAASFQGQVPDQVAQKTVLCAEDYGCVAYLNNGHKVYVIKNGDLIVSVTMSGLDFYFAAVIGVDNLSTNRIDVIPHTFQLEVVDPKKPKNNRNLKFVTADKIIRNQKIAAFIADSLTAVFASTKTSKISIETSSRSNIHAFSSDGVSVSGNGNEISKTTIRTPDYIAQIHANEEIQQRDEILHSSNNSLEGMEMKANTLFPNQYLSGYVFFDRSRMGKFFKLSVRIDNKVFEFPLTLNDFLVQH